jgi:type I restriction enzyme R subunit
MKGRGSRIINLDDLKRVSPSAKSTKDHFVIVDAVGVTKSLKTDSRPLEKKPGVPLKDLLAAIAVGARDEELFTTLAIRLSRLERKISDKEKTAFAEKTNGKTINQVAKELLNAYNPDTMEDLRLKVEQEFPRATPIEKEDKLKALMTDLQNQAASTLTGEVNEYIEKIRKVHEQIIDLVNPDRVTAVGWDKDNKDTAAETVKSFTEWINQHKDEITALQIFYGQPYQRLDLTYKMIKDMADTIIADKPVLAPLNVWRAYSQLESVNGHPKNELIALVGLIRKIVGIDSTLTDYDKTVNRNFQRWIMKKNAGKHNRFNEDQINWLRMIKDHIAASFHVEFDDLDYTPFDSHGGKGKMWQLFGDETNTIIDEMNEALAA